MDEKTLREIDPKEWVVDDTTKKIDYELTIIREYKKPFRLVFTVPIVLNQVAGKALRSLFPNMAPYSKVNVYSLTWTSNPYTILPGYFRCDEHLVVEITETAFYLFIYFWGDAEYIEPKKLHKSFVSALRRSAKGLIIDISQGEPPIEDEEDEDYRYSHSTSIEFETVRKDMDDITLDDFVSFYPLETQLAFRRIIHMVDVLAQEPASGLHFSALLVGPPGTGKSLFSHLVAQHAAKKGALVLWGTGVRGFEYIYDILRMFPFVLFIFDECESLLVSREHTTRSELIFLMRLLDGYSLPVHSSWGIIFTTNLAKNIDKAFLRPIRLDELVELTYFDNGELGYKVFSFHCSRLGIDPPAGVDAKWFEGRTHAECAAVAYKIYRMTKFGYEVTAETVKMLLKGVVKWANPSQLKSSTPDRLGF